MPQNLRIRNDYHAASFHNAIPLGLGRSAGTGRPGRRRFVKGVLFLAGAALVFGVLLAVVPEGLSQNRVDSKNTKAELATLKMPLELPSSITAGREEASEPAPAPNDQDDSTQANASHSEAAAPEPVAAPAPKELTLTTTVVKLAVPAKAEGEPGEAAQAEPDEVSSTSALATTEEASTAGAATTTLAQVTGDESERGTLASDGKSDIGAAATDVQPDSRADEALVSRSVTVRSGHSLYVLFKKIGLSANMLAQLVGSGSDGRQLKRLHPGQRIEFFLDTDNELQRLVYHRSKTESIRFERTGQGFQSVVIDTPLEPRVATAKGEIADSLYLAGRDAGLSDRVIMELAEIYGWDIDFVLDIRSGDKFTVIYEELYKDGEKVKDGPILAAEFVNQGRLIRALRYTDERGTTSYYTPEGKSMRKAFLRSPLNFTRISSPFNLRRKHPVLHTLRAHRGVDYAAPRGTPVKASGHGTVDFVGRKGGYGKAVILRHGSMYTTVYAHLSRYAKGIRAGRRVDQGQVIGYVGSTGLATGPHLHYEFRVRGVQKNPLKVRLPEAEPIDKKYLEDFLAETHPMMVQLDTLSSTQLADSSQ